MFPRRFLIAPFMRFSIRQTLMLRASGLAVLLGFVGSTVSAVAQENLTLIPKWSRFQGELVSLKPYDNPVQDVQLKAEFTPPVGEPVTVDGFWDGGDDWKIRFMPDMVGKWTFKITCSDEENRGLHNLEGAFLCTAPTGDSRLTRNGPIRVARSRTHFMHDNETPFFWMADTAWNGPLKSSELDWKDYLEVRASQGFTAVQWVATHWRGAPDGDANGEKPFSGGEKISINADYFQRLDKRVEMINAAGLVSVPVLFWAIDGEANPVHALPDDQAILLGRYMVARWGGSFGAWILAGDGDYTGDHAVRWRKLGQGIFGDRLQASVFIHPKGKSWVFESFRDEKWLTAMGYQSGHDTNDATNNWIHHGPPSRDWNNLPHRPIVNLEPSYEWQPSYSKNVPISSNHVRRALYWSLLSTPTAGVSYGVAGVWGWDDGDRATPGHPAAGTPPNWRESVTYEGGEQVVHLTEFFQSIDFHKLRPDPAVLIEQPGDDELAKYVAASSAADGSLVVVYTPTEVRLKINVAKLPAPLLANWINPRTGERQDVLAVLRGSALECPAPDAGDWLLVLRAKKPEPEPTGRR